MTEHAMADAQELLLCFLGTGDYKAVHYTLDGRQTEKPEAYVQAAIVELLGAPPDLKVVVLATEDAERKHGETLRKRLPGAEFIRIPSGMNEGQLWEVYTTIENEVPLGARLYFDGTHGLRSLSIVASIVLTWLRTTRGVTIERVLYGAYEARGESNGVAPVLDLTPMFALPAWGEAISEWKRTGRAAGLRQRIKPYLSELGRELKQGNRSRGYAAVANAAGGC